MTAPTPSLPTSPTSCHCGAEANFRLRTLNAHGERVTRHYCAEHSCFFDGLAMASPHPFTREGRTVRLARELHFQATVWPSCAWVAERQRHAIAQGWNDYDVALAHARGVYENAGAVA